MKLVRMLLVTCACALTGLVGGGLAASAAVAAPVEAAYQATGPWAVSTATVNDSSGRAIYQLSYPTDLGRGGVRHPIITWGNGSLATPADYPGLLNHLASWGFAVVASTSSTTGKGTEILAGAQYLVARASDPSSIFNGKLDTAHVGAAGHSQGSGGTINATTRSGGLITSSAVWALPASIWVSRGDEFDVRALTTPTFFMGGQWDVLIAGPGVVTDYYRAAGGPAAAAVLKGADHNTIQRTGGGTLGYLAAWFRYTLSGDTTARSAFAGSTPELLSNTLWQNQAVKSLP
ncbi:alpha/beta hydrolase [Conexibacter sp. JD483]|uniref:poly(ethylene terephthalate) hydrolase family protein n=1 Tax=unclassified Conexibacter TaxID=2627773 RepID=UPI002727981C|nr:MULTISPECIES: alpha/beta hydrolase [unclassified Conexibacter]MDO8188266.1 alpha/beta hydrolase [Conexibacter sp. CPCC 205706]MDO8197379.1 alpha/beta hydrolase [Conexibacter sp. CPCC 205762]MDR9370155.1 alpha/beta hydrolase [Conexibacter sp. JD483]